MRELIPRQMFDVAIQAAVGSQIIARSTVKALGTGLTAEIKYRYLRWKMNRLRKKFDVYQGGKDRKGPWVH